MQYFEKSAGAPERYGQIFGDIFAALTYLGILGLILMWLVH
jgi:hypothetical protein